MAKAWTHRCPTVEELLTHQHERYVLRPNATVDNSGLTQAENYELSHPEARLSQDQSVAFNATVEMLHWASVVGAWSASPGGPHEVERSDAQKKMVGFSKVVYDFILRGKV